MKLLRSNPQCSYAISKVFGAFFYHTKTLARSATPNDTLLFRISRAGDPRFPIVRVIDQWLEEGRDISNADLQRIIKQLRRHRRHTHALQISEWLSDHGGHHLPPRDIAIWLDLISKVRGLKEVEKYFDSIRDTSRMYEVYGALLNCYVEHLSLDKAEATIQKMRELGFLKNSLPYNVMLSLYSRMGKTEKLDILMQEMEDKGIDWDVFTFNIRLNAYAATSDIEGMEKFLMKMEADLEISIDWEEVYRIWTLYKKIGKFLNTGLSLHDKIISLDDLDGAEKILEEWESENTPFDIRVPRTLITGYCKKGLLEKAEAYINWHIKSGKEPDSKMWECLTIGYHVHGQMEKAVETMKKSLLACRPGRVPTRLILAACLGYLKEKGDVQTAEEILRLLRDNCHFSTSICEELKNYFHGENPGSEAFDHLKGSDQDDQDLDSEAQGVLELKSNCCS
ncbi:hypothetical protein CJ030_MR6G023546 [Morella rubra]|uniref:Pentacotripeptide-repeat region of PRORP domain-containing protein n=1 Tax=Morella rubra TaxID=262757 RepID=A0A6A1VDV0_9ROSI|nr:hypothetical protein CJ030_MR6G023546 [Morella rubra]